MRTYERLRHTLGVGLTVALLGGGSAAAEEEVYTATLTSARGLGKKTAELTLTITSRATDEEAAELQRILREQGSAAAFDALRGVDRGVARIEGGPSSAIRYVRVHPGQNGARVIIITDSALSFPEDAPPPSATAPVGSVGLIDLAIASDGSGRGNLVEALKVTVTPEGVFQVTTPGKIRIDLENVRRKR